MDLKPWPYPRLFAHRAGGTLAPENTLGAMRLAKSLGYRAVEIDVRFSRDGVAVLQHDAAIDRNTNGKGPIAERTWSELETLDAGSWRGESYLGERLARLPEAAALLRSLGMFAHVEVKRVPGRHRECGERVAQAAAACWQGSSQAPLLISFSAEALAGAMAAEPSLGRGWIVEEPWDGDLAPLERLDAASFHLEHVLVTPDLVETVQAQGRRVLAWTVNEPSRAEELLALGVDGIVTDNIREFASRFPEML